MHTRRMSVSEAILCSLLVAAWLLPSAAASEGSRTLAEMTIRASRIDWQPAGDSATFTLTVAGPEGLWFRTEFEAGQPASLDLFDENGQQLPDGTYTYELRPASRREKPLVQSGHFSIKNGSFVTASAKPPLRNVTANLTDDELIIQGNACIGGSCTTTDNDFPVLKLKGQNPNILFDDVEDPPSLVASEFNDWAIRINPSGAAQFSIFDVDGGLTPFSILGGAPDNSLFIRDNGNVGIGTATPAARLEVSGGEVRLPPGSGGLGGFTHFNYSGDGKNYIRGTTILVDIGGKVGIGTASPVALLDVKANAPTLAVDRIQNTSGSGYSGTEYLNHSGTATSFFGIDNGALTTRLNSNGSYPIVMLINSTERVRIDSDGDVGINCNNPTSDLVIASGSGCSTPSSSLNAGSTSFTVSSSRTIKENLAPVQVPGLLDKIARVDVFRYDFIQGPKDRLGLMAEDFHQIFERGPDKVIDGQEVQMALWLAVQELTALNKELREQNLEIRKRLADVEAHLPVAPQQ